MATSNRSRQRHAGVFADQAVAMAWGAWVELGVSGWSATHRQWAIDPEPLIILTALVQDADRRLRDEATDWCIRNWRSVSKTRLRNLVRDQSPNVREAYGEFAATVGEHIPVKWPYATEPRRFTVTGRSVAPQLDQPSMVWLRLRAMFGLGARAEILRHVLVHDDDQSSIAAISAATSYTKRNVAEECETLEQAGVLRVRTVGNRFYYSLAKRAELEAFVGTMSGIPTELGRHAECCRSACGPRSRQCHLYQPHPGGPCPQGNRCHGWRPRRAQDRVTWLARRWTRTVDRDPAARRPDARKVVAGPVASPRLARSEGLEPPTF